MRANLSVSYEVDRVEVRLRHLDTDVTEHLVSLLGRVRQSHIHFIILHFDNVVVAQHPSKIADRIEWSRRGQILRNFIMQCPQYTVAFIRGDCFGEPFETAMACCKVFAESSAKFGLTSMPMWGSLRQLVGSSSGGNHNISIDYRSFGLERVVRVSDLNEVYDHVSDIAQVTEKMSPFDRSLNSMLESMYDQVDLIEAVLFGNRAFLEAFENITFTKPDQYSEIIPDPSIFTMEQNRVEHPRFKYSPVQRATKDLRTYHVAQMQNLLSQTRFPIKGRCIELGSGGGRFSMFLSKRKEVTEVVAADVNVAAVYWMTPILAEKIDPDWSKMRYLIGDFNTLRDDEGFDVAVFCASLHEQHDHHIERSIRQAFDLLKPGGILILHGEHIYPLLFSNKFFRGQREAINRGPFSVPSLNRKLRKCGFTPHVFHNITRGQRFPILKRLLLEKLPTKWLNGWIYFSQLSIIGVKPKR